MLTPHHLTTINNCKISISPKPDSTDIKQDLERVLGATFDKVILVSALTTREEELFGLESEKAICAELGLKFYHFPIQDSYIPNPSKFVQFMEDLYALTPQTDKILIHCRAGIGRSGLLAVGLMVRHGLDVEKSMKEASAIRGINVPESASQKKLLYWYWEKIQKKE